MITSEILTAAADAGSEAAALLTSPPGSSMALTTRKLTDYTGDQPARKAFAQAAIETFLTKMEDDGLKMRIVNHGYEKQIKELEDARDAHKTLREDIARSLRACEARETELKHEVARLQGQLGDSRQASEKLLEDIKLQNVRIKELEKNLRHMEDSWSKAVAALGKERETSGWVKFNDRHPALEDADIEGNVCCMGVDGVMFLSPSGMGRASDVAMWRPTNNPVPTPPFIRWKRSLTENQIERFGGPYNLDEVWKDITSFLEQNPS